MHAAAQRALATKLKFEKEALVLQKDHSLSKEAITKIAQQFVGRQVFLCHADQQHNLKHEPAT